jgi:hypothetical protein
MCMFVSHAMNTFLTARRSPFFEIALSFLFSYAGVSTLRIRQRTSGGAHIRLVGARFQRKWFSIWSLFEFVELAMHWSDSNHKKRTVVPQSVLVMNIVSSLVLHATRMLMISHAFELPRTNHRFLPTRGTFHRFVSGVHFNHCRVFARTFRCILLAVARQNSVTSVDDP